VKEKKYHRVLHITATIFSLKKKLIGNNRKTRKYQGTREYWWSCGQTHSYPSDPIWMFYV